jgi:hypothetical protein
MPGSGGGIEIALEKVGRSVQLFPLSWDRREVVATLKRSLNAKWETMDTSNFTCGSVADLYFQVDARFHSDGRYSPFN